MATENSRFLLTSVSKVFAAEDAMLQISRGRVGLLEPMATRIPDFGAFGKEHISPLHVLTHTSGVPRCSGNTIETLDPPVDRAYHLEAAMRSVVARRAGEAVEYSSSPFWALDLLLERATGMSAAERAEEMASLVGMSSTGYFTDVEPPPGLVRVRDSEGRVRGDAIRRLAYPAGGLIGTLADLMAFGHWVLSSLRGVQTEVSCSLRHASVVPWTRGLFGRREPDHLGPGTERGIGWGLGGPGACRPDSTLWHAGVSGCSVWIDPSQSWVIVLLTASWGLRRDVLGGFSDVVFRATDPG